ncbi:MAG: hypothetical protein JNL84_11520 [Candidatus Accumulibacter sp.]|nr:hypothetical protein [Accumulibacter sp.]
MRHEPERKWQGKGIGEEWVRQFQEPLFGVCLTTRDDRMARAFEYLEVFGNCQRDWLRPAATPRHGNSFVTGGEPRNPNNSAADEQQLLKDEE